MRNQKNELKLLKCIEQDCTLSTAQLAAMCDMTEEEVKSCRDATRDEEAAYQKQFENLLKEWIEV